MSDSVFEKAVRLKGYGSYSKGKSRSCVEGVKSLKGGKVNVTVIESLEDYVRFVDTLKTDFVNPVFYRGQTNANYLLTPYSLRNNPANENLMIEAFSRYFSNEVDACRNAVEKLALMQHFGLKTRFLDISENPLAALYFACVPGKKFRKPAANGEPEAWGEIVLFREPEKKDNKTKPARPKTAESSDASIIANTAFMERGFHLWKLGSLWKKDANQAYNEKYIDLRSIVRKSLIVRVPQNNPRIKNQRGAFILANANMACIWKDDKEIKQGELTKYILQSKEEITYASLLENSPFKDDLDENKTWHMNFCKVKPYDDDNGFEEFRTDPFDLRRIFYKDEKGVQQVVLIPPGAKDTIKDELARFNIREDFIYPDMDSVANVINETIDKKEQDGTSS